MALRTKQFRFLDIDAPADVRSLGFSDGALQVVMDSASFWTSMFLSREVALKMFELLHRELFVTDTRRGSAALNGFRGKLDRFRARWEFSPLTIWHAIRNSMVVFALCVLLVGVAFWIGDGLDLLCGPVVCTWQ